MTKSKTVVLIPALNPDEKLITIVNELIDLGVYKIIVINDGSSDKCNNIFNDIKAKGIEVLAHETNKGKGRALKTGFEYIVKNSIDCIGVVTADADGQHSTKDITNIIKNLEKNQTKLILGSRAFDKKVPVKSVIGNTITRTLFKRAHGIFLKDTQTGLRAIPISYMKKLINIDGERFEFEMNMLIKAKENNVDIKEVDIETIYIDKNKQSKFKPMTDSAKVIGTLFKYVISSLLSFLIDIVIFGTLIFLLKQSMPKTYIIISTVVARTTSSILNFTINRKVVFGAKKNLKKQVVKYYSLCIIQMFLSGILVTIIHLFIKRQEVMIKVLVDIILFAISFKIQKNNVFKEDKNVCG